MKILSNLLKAIRLAVGLTWKIPKILHRFRFPRSAEKLLDGFSHEPITYRAYEDLMRYMVTSWITYRNKTSSGAIYPGLPSWSGPECDSLEGFARIMPLFGAWCSSARDQKIDLPGGKFLLLTNEFKLGLIAGTDPNASTYWGDMPGISNQRIVEAADVALALWFFRDTVWQKLTTQERDNVINWLSLVNGKKGLDNNWHLFFILIDRIITALGYSDRIEGVRERYHRIKDFHLGEGWFKDGPDGRVDFYNAWGFHYALTWVNRVDPEWDPVFIDNVQAKFLKSYKYLISPKGLPILGRSIPYRIAAAAPLVAGAENHKEIVSPGEARRALDVTWSYFLSFGALRRGIITQGYFGTNPQILDPYSSPASSLWSLRSLIMAFYYPENHSFWKADAEPLPIEKSDFEFTLTGIGWKVTGEKSSGTIQIEILSNPIGARPELKPFKTIQALQNLAFGKPQRPKNLEAKYGRRFYRSDRPFFMDSQSGVE